MVQDNYNFSFVCVWTTRFKYSRLQLREFKAIGGLSHVFFQLILYYRVFTKFQVAFYRFKKLKLFI